MPVSPNLNVLHGLDAAEVSYAAEIESCYEVNHSCGAGRKVDHWHGMAYAVALSLQSMVKANSDRVVDEYHVPYLCLAMVS